MKKKSPGMIYMENWVQTNFQLKHKNLSDDEILHRYSESHSMGTCNRKLTILALRKAMNNVL